MENKWRNFYSNWVSVLGLIILLLLTVTALIGPVIAPFDPEDLEIGRRATAPNSMYWVGTDELGRDVFSRAVTATRVSLLVGIIAAGVSTLVGILVGSLSGFFGGWLDHILMRITEVFQVVPQFFLAVVLVALFGASVLNIIVAIALLTWPIIARLTRSEFLSLKSRQYVDAAYLGGASNTRLIFREILPNAMGPIIVSATLLVGRAMLTEAGLSFLGLGDPSRISLGVMLYQSRPFVQFAWWAALFPGMMIFLAVLSTNLIGDGLNDVINPHLNEEK
jgi:peptide/nickel transport system permease protein|tara:strand:+ start:54 stop:887 length:834 start_codon:yes stop_codon:yes gene_type:complete